MNDTWQAALAFIWRPENDGQSYHQEEDDPGSGTAWAVTEATWAEAVRRRIVEGGALRAATKDQLANILYTMYWREEGCTWLPPGVDMVVFNMAVLAGPARSGKIIQHIVGVKEDGVIGPVTLAAVKTFTPATLIDELTRVDETFLASLADAQWFVKGWDRRAEDCRDAAYKLLGVDVTPPRQATGTALVPTEPAQPPTVIEPASTDAA